MKIYSMKITHYCSNFARCSRVYVMHKIYCQRVNMAGCFPDFPPVIKVK